MSRDKLLRLSKVLVIIYMSLTFINVLLPDEFVIGIRALCYVPGDFQMIIRWFNFVGFVTLPICVYFDRNIFKKIAIYFCLPVAIIYMCLYSEIIPCLTSKLGTGISDIRYLPDVVENFMHNEIFRSILFFLIGVIEIAVIVLVLIRDFKVLKFKKNEIIPFIVLLMLLILTIIPIYALEGIFYTYTNVVFKAFSILHFIWIFILILQIVVFTKIFKRRSEEDRYILVLILALSLFLQFNMLFSSLGELTCKRMPLQLCNLASYTILIGILKKNRTLFLFNLLTNVAGAVIALLVLDVENKGILLKSNIHYIVEHNNVILVPILCLTLGIFKPIKNKDFKNFAIGFSLYFVCIFIIGTTFNALSRYYNSNFFACNYLFMFDQATAARLIPFAGSLFDISIEIGYVIIYPVIQILIYVVFFLIGVLSFFIFKNVVKEKDELNEVKLELES